jgi:hypothetical protein
VFRDEYRTTQGSRLETQFEMMWEKEWMEFSKTAKCGYLSSEEATAMWESWLADADVSKDKKGPRGFIRVAVPCKDIKISFWEGAHSKALERNERLGRNTSEATLEERQRQLMAGQSSSSLTGLDASWSALERNANMAGLALESEFERVAPAVSDLLQAEKRKRHSKEWAKNESGSETEAKDDKEPGDDKEKDKWDKDSTPDAAWFDADTKINRSERKFDSQAFWDGWLVGWLGREGRLRNLRWIVAANLSWAGSPGG